MKKQFSFASVRRFVLCAFAAIGMLTLQQAEAQSNGGGNLQGTIVDEAGLPVIGASVVIKGTTRGVTSDLDGKFTFTDLKAGDIIEVSYIGYADQEVAYHNQSEMTIVLSEAATQMDALVVTALGIKKEAKSISYHVQSIEPEGVVNPSGSFVNSLTGKVAGVTINAASSGVGGSSRVVMRGTKSLFGNNNALYVIDGIPMMDLQHDQARDSYSGMGATGDGLASINPDDIENISVLSGPSAAALYGSSAANGVVMITTKKGTTDKFSVNYSNSTTFQSAYIMPSFQNTYGHTETGSYQSWGDKLATPSTYHPRDYFQTGFNETNAVSISAGNAKNQTYFSAASTNAEGIIHGNDYDRYNFSGRNTTSFLKDKMTLDVNFMYSHITEQNMITQGQYMNPVVPVYLFPAGDDFDRLKIYQRYNAARGIMDQYWPYDVDETYMQNPYWITERNKLTNTKERFMASAQLKYDIADWINISGRAKIDKSNESFDRKLSAGTHPLFAGRYGHYRKDDQATRQIYAEALLNINKYFNHDISLTATLGTNLEDIDHQQQMYGGNLASVANLFSFNNVDETTQLRSQSAYHTMKQAIFLNAQVGWKGAIYLDVTGRNDWTSTLAGSKMKSFFYPTVGLSGILTEFIPANNILSYWKVRVSYSEVGNDPTYFLTIPTYPISGGSPTTMTRLPNLDLQPERTRSWEVGTNIYLFKNHLKIDATYYQSSTYNQFFTAPLSPSTGYTSVVVNAGQVDNRGMELSARYSDDYAAGKVHFSTYLTFSFNRNKIVKLLDNWETPLGETVSMKEIDMGGMVQGIHTILKEGGSMSDVYVTSLRTDEHGAIYVDPRSQSVVADQTNYIYAGDTAPRYNLGWGADLSWKGITLNFLFTGRLGGIVLSPTQATLDYYGVSKASAADREAGGALVNGFRIPAQAYYQTIGGQRGNGVMSKYVYDATNIRLGELTLGYDFPVQKWCNWIKGLNVSFVGRNLWMIYKKAPFDPEMTSNTSDFYMQGVDYFMQPSTRTLGFSVKVKF